MNSEPLFMEMISYYSSHPKQIQHFIKVHGFAKRIALSEQLDEKTLAIVETAAIVHDIGIKPSWEKYGDSMGKHQEELGPDIAKDMLEKLNYPADVIERVCYLVAHHHTYNQIDGNDYQILVEADFLVNIYEDDMSKDAVASVFQKIFRTETGKRICRIIYGLKEK